MTVRFAHHLLTLCHTLILDVLLRVIVGHSKRIWLAVLVLARQNALATRVLILSIVPDGRQVKVPFPLTVQVISAAVSERGGFAFEFPFAEAELDAFGARHQAVNVFEARSNQTGGWNTQNGPRFVEALLRHYNCAYYDNSNGSSHRYTR